MEDAPAACRDAPWRVRVYAKGAAGGRATARPYTEDALKSKGVNAIFAHSIEIFSCHSSNRPLWFYFFFAYPKLVSILFNLSLCMAVWCTQVFAQGTRYDDTVIAELYFDGIDVH